VLQFGANGQEYAIAFQRNLILRKESELLQCSVGRNEGLVDRTHGMIGAAAITRGEMV